MWPKYWVLFLEADDTDNVFRFQPFPVSENRKTSETWEKHAKTWEHFCHLADAKSHTGGLNTIKQADHTKEYII